MVLVYGNRYSNELHAIKIINNNNNNKKHAAYML